MLLEQHLLTQALSGAKQVSSIQLLQTDPAIADAQAECPFLPELLSRFRGLSTTLCAPLFPGLKRKTQSSELIQWRRQ